MKKNTLPLFICTLFLLASCSNHTEATPQATSTNVLDLGTPLAVSSPEASSQLESEQATSYTTTSGDAAGSSTSTTGSPVDVSVWVGKLSAQEKTRFEAGEYVAATQEHPALNVPVPVLPEAAKEKTDSGAKAFVEYWVTTRNYTSQTGDKSYEIAAINSDLNKSEVEVAEKYQQFYQNGGWAEDCLDATRVSPTYEVKIIEDSPTEVRVIPHDNACKIYDAQSKKIYDLAALDKGDQETIVYLDWVGNKWQVRELSGIVDVNYEK